MLHTNTTFTWSRNMATVEERISLLAQQVTTMTPDVSMLRSEIAGFGAHFAECMVRLVKDDPRIKRIVGPVSSRRYKLSKQGSPIQRASRVSGLMRRATSRRTCGSLRKGVAHCVRDGAADLGRSLA